MDFKDIANGTDLDTWAKEWAQSPEIYNRFVNNCMKHVDATLLTTDDSEVDFACNIGELVMRVGQERVAAYLLYFGDQVYALPYDPVTFKFTDARFVDPDVPELEPSNKLH